MEKEEDSTVRRVLAVIGGCCSVATFGMGYAFGSLSNYFAAYYSDPDTPVTAGDLMGNVAIRGLLIILAMPTGPLLLRSGLTLRMYASGS